MHLKPVIWILGGVGAILVLKRANPNSPLGKLAAPLNPALKAIPIGGPGQLLGATTGARPPAVGPNPTNLATRYGTATSPLAPGLKTNAPLPPGIGTQVGLATQGIGGLLSGLANIFRPSTAPKPLALPPASAPPNQAKPSAPGGNTSLGGGPSGVGSAISRPPSAVGYDIRGNLTSDPSKVYQTLDGRIVNLADAGYLGFDINGNPTYDGSKVYQDLNGNIVNPADAGYAGYDVNGNLTFDQNAVYQNLNGTVVNPADAGYAGYDVNGNLTYDPGAVYQDLAGNVLNYQDAGYLGYDINGNPTYDPSLVYQDLGGNIVAPQMAEPYVDQGPQQDFGPDYGPFLETNAFPNNPDTGAVDYTPQDNFSTQVVETDFSQLGDYFSTNGSGYYEPDVTTGIASVDNFDYAGGEYTEDYVGG